MSTYAIGDIQGCYSELQDLLHEINFDKENDRLWFVGDLINRGPKSLQTLRFVKSLGTNAKVVLGNHDLHLLAASKNIRPLSKKDTIKEVLAAEDKEQLINWIKSRPLLITDNDLGFTMVHAGLAPQWTLEDAKNFANECELTLQSEKINDFLTLMYGDKPNIWSESLEGYERQRFIINCFTRIRFCNDNGKLDLDTKVAPGEQKKSLIPWYALPKRKTIDDKIIFGHWSTVHLGNEKNFKQYNVFPIDTGCLWGGRLTAMRLEDKKIFSVPSKQPKF
ncbi:MAG: symmetrical bis(5'-nucleosyl)-tetraphosphatase [Pseudomonadota bacterium]|nr:symmetrical bis(5'-nucleosyl)-tetraphosphatase [Pseudomonadota bacterium]|tara:strand:- start:2173 stop:3006 length:834 start_codon:yes stop_codon:yes gene_type:complete